MDYKNNPEVLEWARKHWMEASDVEKKHWEFVFPELRNGEDERIRKHLIELVKEAATGRMLLVVTEQHAAEWIAWLEKRKASADYANEEYWRGYREGKQEVLDKYAELEKQKEQKPIKWTDLTWKDIVELEGIINSVHCEFSAGIGQVSFGKEVLERFRSTKGVEYLDEVEQKYWKAEGLKEQKPLSTEETELNSIAFLEQLGYTCIPSGDEDRYMEGYMNGMNDALKRAEWSEEDEEMRIKIMSLLSSRCSVNEYKEIEDWFKSLRPQPHWKPSEEQMDALEECGECKRCLKELYEQLKKLM